MQTPWTGQGHASTTGPPSHDAATLDGPGPRQAGREEGGRGRGAPPGRAAGRCERPARPRGVALQPGSSSARRPAHSRPSRAAAAAEPERGARSRSAAEPPARRGPPTAAAPAGPHHAAAGGGGGRRPGRPGRAHRFPGRGRGAGQGRRARLGPRRPGRAQVVAGQRDREPLRRRLRLRLRGGATPPAAPRKFPEAPRLPRRSGATAARWGLFQGPPLPRLPLPDAPRAGQPLPLQRRPVARRRPHLPADEVAAAGRARRRRAQGQPVALAGALGQQGAGGAARSSHAPADAAHHLQQRPLLARLAARAPLARHRPQDGYPAAASPPRAAPLLPAVAGSRGPDPAPARLARAAARPARVLHPSRRLSAPLPCPRHERLHVQLDVEPLLAPRGAAAEPRASPAGHPASHHRLARREAGAGSARRQPRRQREIPGGGEEGGGEEAPHQEAAQRLHALHEGDEGQGGGRVHAEGERRHQPDPGPAVALAVAGGAGQVLRAGAQGAAAALAALPDLVRPRQLRQEEEAEAREAGAAAKPRGRGFAGLQEQEAVRAVRAGREALRQPGLVPRQHAGFAGHAVGGLGFAGRPGGHPLRTGSAALAHHQSGGEGRSARRPRGRFPGGQSFGRPRRSGLAPLQTFPSVPSGRAANAAPFLGHQTGRLKEPLGSDRGGGGAPPFSAAMEIRTPPNAVIGQYLTRSELFS